MDDFDHGILSDIFGGLTVAKDAQAVGENLVLMAGKQEAHGAAVPFADGGDEAGIDIGRGLRSGGRWNFDWAERCAPAGVAVGCAGAGGWGRGSRQVLGFGRRREVIRSMPLGLFRSGGVALQGSGVYYPLARVMMEIRSVMMVPLWRAWAVMALTSEPR